VLDPLLEVLVQYRSRADLSASIVALFERMDVNASGSILYEEMVESLAKMFPDISFSREAWEDICIPHKNIGDTSPALSSSEFTDMIMHQLKLFHFRHLNQATLGGEETKHAELLSIKWLLLYLDMQSALELSPAVPLGGDDREHRSPSSLDKAPWNRVPEGESVSMRELQTRSSALQVQAGSDQYGPNNGDGDQRTSPADRQRELQVEEKTKAEASRREFPSSVGDRRFPLHPERGDAEEVTDSLYKEMREIKKEREIERERVRAKDKEMERDRLRMEEEIRVLRREGERDKERDSLQAEVEELKRQLTGRVGDEGKMTVRAMEGQTSPEDTGGEEMERLLEENMVRCPGLTLAFL